MLRSISRVRASQKPTLQHGSSSSRMYARPTLAALKPGEAAAAHDADNYEDFFATNTLASRSDSFIQQAASQPIRLYEPLLHRSDQRIIHPPPLTVDQDSTTKNATLFPSTGFIESVSLISVCLDSAETIPRAYDLFQKLVSDFIAEQGPFPGLEIWAVVIQGVASLGDSDPKWYRRAEDIVLQWQRATLNDFSSDSKSHGKGAHFRKEDRILILSSLLQGLVEAGAQTEGMEIFFKFHKPKDVSVYELITGWTEEHRKSCLEKVLAAAKELDNKSVIQDVEVAYDMERARRERALPELPQVRPILETGTPTEITKQNLPELNKEMPLPRFPIVNLRNQFSKIPVEEVPYRKQEALEVASLHAAEDELKHAHQKIQAAGLDEVEKAQTLQSGKLQAWMHQWKQDLSEKLTQEIARMEETKKSRHTPKQADLLLFLKVLPPDTLALVTILEVMRTCGSGGIPDGFKALRGAAQVGKAVETEYRASLMRIVLGESGLMQATEKVGLASKNEPMTPRKVSALWRMVGKEALAEGAAKEEDSEDTRKGTLTKLKQVWAPDWAQTVHVSVGSFCLNALVETAYIERSKTDANGVVHTETQPAFQHNYEYMRGQKLGLVVLNPGVAARLTRDNMSVVVHPKHMPMLIKPRPWTAHDDGGYLMHRVSVMRYKEGPEQGTYLKSASDAGHLTDIFAGLDVLSSTPWRINRAVFEVLVECWNSGQAIASLPPSEENSALKLPTRPNPRDLDPAVHNEYVQRFKSVQAEMRKAHSERCKFNYNLELARAYANEKFYIPHNLDFRGRAYAVPPHLNPLGDDLCRSLLTFGEARPLGEHGLTWLRIHLANLYGHGKASFADREAFTIKHEKEILDSADNPLNGSRWWVQAEDPFQCLATCKELANALRSEDPTKFMSSLPIHQDGTCNGMQHYAALGGDFAGAKSVNLVRGDKPADVYTRIAELTSAIIDQDAAAGKLQATIAKGHITRKVVKQTVMTTVYGVTFIGAKEQISKQFVAAGNIPRELVFHVATYVTSTVLSCIGELFSGAKAIQDWLSVGARLICKGTPEGRMERLASQPRDRKKKKLPGTPIKKSHSVESEDSSDHMNSVIWTTPLGLPVVQPYRKTVRKQVLTALQSVFISDPNAMNEVSPAKQSTAMPPNYIHSLDATHMLMCASQCAKDGLTFASVHDSYWTHAGTVHQMNKHIRDTFVQLHSKDLIDDLRKEFLERYKDLVIPLKHVRDIYSAQASRLKKRNAFLTSLPEEKMDESLAKQAEELSGEPEVEFSPYENEDGTAKEIVIIGGKQYMRFVDVLPPTPRKGGFDINEVRHSPYFFS